MDNEIKFLLYTTPEENVTVQAVVKDENLWLTQKSMAELFGCTTDNISLHLKNIFETGELDKNSVTEKISATANDGKNYITQFYNLDAIISVGYRVSSSKATKFRIWATQILNPKYVSYALSTTNARMQKSKGKVKSKVVHTSVPSLQEIEIPLPPLPVQEAIVNILDRFAVYAAELQAELQARQQQYNYYRDTLLSFDGRDDVQWVKLGEVADLLSGFPFDSTQFTNAGVRLMRGVNIKRGQLCFNENDDRYWKSTTGLEKYIVDENDIVISMDGSLVGKSFGMVKKEHLPLLLVQRVARIRSSVFNINFIYHCINNWFPDYVNKKKTQGAIPHISMKDIANFPIPSPSLEEQGKIATILDRFDNLVNDLSQGLPAEIEARQQQYEYYRDQLLTFKRKEA